MAAKFEGGQEHTLKASGAISANGASEWITLPDSEIFEFEVAASAHTGADLYVALETEIAGGSYYAKYIQITGIQTKKELVSLGGLPGGSRVRASWTKASGSTTAAVMLRETRSGLG